MVTDKPEFLKVAAILARSNISEEDCIYIANLIINSVKDKNNLIKYLESLLTGKDTIDKFVVTGVVDLLERIKSGKYE